MTWSTENYLRLVLSANEEDEVEFDVKGATKRVLVMRIEREQVAAEVA